MRFNLGQFGKLIDCGYVTGGSGIYAGGGYAVLAVEKGKHTALTHAFNWTYYNPVDYSSPSGNLLQIQKQVLVFATWAAMPPSCKYCHSMDHALIDCALRKKKLTCDLCHEFRHFQRECPRRNEDSSKSGKKRKVSQGSKKNAVSQPSSTTSSESASSPSQSQIDKAASNKANAAATVARATTDNQATVDADKAPSTCSPLQYQISIWSYALDHPIYCNCHSCL
ncbi:hypothetical protein PS15m_006623 [Mucor circinelloides]